MFKNLTLLGLTFILNTACFQQEIGDSKNHQTPQKARIKTVYGDLLLRFNDHEAPNSVQRIKHLIQQGFYNGLSFHKVIPGFIIQTGDPTGDGNGGSGKKIAFETTNTPHLTGTVSLARLEEDLHSADSQFFITLKESPELNGKYTVIGKIVTGLNLLEKIKLNDKIITISLE